MTRDGPASHEPGDETMKTAKNAAKHAAAKHAIKTVRVGDEVTIGFADRYWANGLTGTVIDIIERTPGVPMLYGVRVYGDMVPNYACTIDCPPHAIVKLTAKAVA